MTQAELPAVSRPAASQPSFTQSANRRPVRVLTTLSIMALIAIACFMLIGAHKNWAFILPFRATKVLALVLVAYAIAVSTILFQTVTANRILTPSIMGFDALYILIQTVIVFFFSAQALSSTDPRLQYLLEVVVMTVFSGILFQWLFMSGNRSLHLLVLVGIVCGVFFRSLSSLMQRMLDPNEFLVLQDTFFASFNSIDQTLLGISLLIVGLASLIGLKIMPYLDVIALGRPAAISLGVPYKATVATILIVVAMLVSVSTALVGPITFFGLLIASLAHAIAGTSRHRYILPIAILLGIICLVGGQTLLERLFAFNTALSIVIEFLGGVVFIVLVLKKAMR
ncbi:MAG: iron chelate uptake ABC transporter family permease subunit [Alcaligenaceae bacterium]|nr:iron chelate uptake ABC transporter family permease subunit [Alcaligenaceae bacterium]